MRTLLCAERHSMAAWRARSSYLVDAVRFFLPVIVQRDSAHMLAIDLEQDGKIPLLTSRPCAAWPQCCISLLLRAASLRWCCGVEGLSESSSSSSPNVVVDPNTTKVRPCPRTRPTKAATGTPLPAAALTSSTGKRRRLGQAKHIALG